MNRPFHDLNLQKTFFDRQSHRYPPSLVLNPPLHTQMEIDALLLRLPDTNSPVADFGAGSGRITLPLLLKGKSVWAIDISQSSLDEIVTLAKSQSLSVPHMSASLPNRPTFGAVVGADILHHVSLPDILAKIYNCLKPGGKIIFSEPCAWNISWYIYLGLFFDWQVEKGMTKCTFFYFHRQLSQAGFKNVRLTGLGFFPPPFLKFFPPLLKLNNWLGNLPLLKLFAYRYIVEAYK